MLATTSSNLAKLAPSLVYEIRPVTVHDWTGNPIATADISHVGESKATGHDLLKPATDSDPEQSAVDEAEEFLRAELAAGPKLAKTVQAAAHDLGISHITLKRAKKALGIEPGKDGYQGPWKWYLNAEQQRGSPGRDPLCETELDPLCRNLVDTGDSGRDRTKGDQAQTGEPLWPQSADLRTSSDHYAGRNDHGAEMPF